MKKIILIGLILLGAVNCSNEESSSNSDDLIEQGVVNAVSSISALPNFDALVEGGYLLTGQNILQVNLDGDSSVVSDHPDGGFGLGRFYNGAIVVKDNEEIIGLVSWYVSSLAFDGSDQQQGLVLSDIRNNDVTAYTDYNLKNDFDIRYPLTCTQNELKIYCLFSNPTDIPGSGNFGEPDYVSPVLSFENDITLVVADLVIDDDLSLENFSTYSLSGIDNPSSMAVLNDELIIASAGDLYNNLDAVGGLFTIHISEIGESENLIIDQSIESIAGFGLSGISVRNDQAMIFGNNKIFLYDGIDLQEVSLPESLGVVTSVAKGLFRGSDILVNIQSDLGDERKLASYQFILSDDLLSVSEVIELGPLSFPGLASFVRLSGDTYITGEYDYFSAGNIQFYEASIQ